MWTARGQNQRRGLLDVAIMSQIFAPLFLQEMPLIFRCSATVIPLLFAAIYGEK
jgi:hypothetical protein